MINRTIVRAKHFRDIFIAIEPAEPAIGPLQRVLRSITRYVLLPLFPTVKCTILQ